jgi:hypothetical protein
MRQRNRSNEPTKIENKRISKPMSANERRYWQILEIPCRRCLKTITQRQWLEVEHRLPVLDICHRCSASAWNEKIHEEWRKKVQYR